MADEVIANPSLPSFFLADPAGEGLTYEQLKQRRAVAAALASRARPYPTTIGQGIASFGESFGNAMYDRQIMAHELALKERERKGDTEAGRAEPPPTVAPGRRASVEPPMVTSPASLVTSLDPAIDAGRSEVAARAARNPVLASAYTGTVSDAGPAGLTYAGPGGAIAEPPDRAAPDQSIETGRDAVASTMVAQLGGGRPGAGPAAGAGSAPRIRVGPPSPAQQPPGQPIQPPRDTGLAQPGGEHLPPGVTTLEPLGPRPALPPQPQEPGETPAMRTLRGVIQKNKGMVSPEKEAAWKLQYDTMKSIQDRSHTEAMEKWKLDYAQGQREQVEWDKRQKQLPQEREKAAEETRKGTIGQRFGDPETHKRAVAEASTSADKAKTYKNALPDLYKALDIVRSGKPMVTGPFAQQGIGLSTPWGNVGGPSGMTAHGIWGVTPFPGNQWSRDAVNNTQEFRSLLRPLMAAVLGQTTGAGSISNIEVEQAAEALGLKGDMNREAIVKVLENWVEKSHRLIGQHNQALDRNFPRAQDLDAAEHRQYKVTIPFEPADVKLLRAEPSGLRRQMFEQRYGRGSADRALRGEE